MGFLLSDASRRVLILLDLIMYVMELKKIKKIVHLHHGDPSRPFSRFAAIGHCGKDGLVTPEGYF